MAPKKKQATAKGKAAMEVDEEKEEEAAKPTAKQASDSQLIEMLQALRADMSKFGQELTRQGGPLDRIDQRLNRLERAQYAEPVGGARPSGVDAVAAAHLEPVAAAAADGPTVAWRVRGFPQRETRLHDIKVARGKEEREGLAGYWVWEGAGSGREGRALLSAGCSPRSSPVRTRAHLRPTRWRTSSRRCPRTATRTPPRAPASACAMPSSTGARTSSARR